MDYCRAFLLFSGFALPVFGGGGGGGGGGGLITSSLHTSHGTGYEFLGIYRLWRVLSLKVVVLERGGILCGPPKTLHTTVTIDSLPARK